jgi:hypothetical protein
VAPIGVFADELFYRRGQLGYKLRKGNEATRHKGKPQQANTAKG